MAAFTQKMIAPSSRIAAAKPAVRSPMHLQPARRAVSAKAIDDTNIFINIFASAACVTIPAAVTIATSANRDAEIERVQTVEGALPFIGAAAADAIAHSIPGLNVLLSLIAEPAGACSGVAYMMSLLLAAAAIDPATLAPKGTVLNVETAKDASASVRVPFTQIIPTTLKVIDWSNEGSSGKAWTVEDGIPKLPANSVIAVLAVGTLILEAASHAPVLSVFMPRVLTCAAWLAAVGMVLDKRTK